MVEMLKQGDHFPSVTLKLLDGGTITIPDEMPGRYVLLLFYRGHWSPYCGRQLAAYEEHKAELEALGATIYAISVDDPEQAREIRDKNGVTFAVAHGATREDGDSIGAWWSEDRDGYIQPAEFLLGRGGTVLGAMYASGPIGRMGVDEATRMITNRENCRREQEGEAH